MKAGPEHLHAPAADGSFLENLFATDFMPRAQCVGDCGEIIWLHVVADSIIALAYFSIPIALMELVRRRKDLAFNWMFALFAAFILLCGTTHVFGVLAFWYPMYRLDGVVRLLTAIVSIATAWMLWPLIAKAAAMPGPAQFSAQNAALQREVEESRRMERELSTANARLELGVSERTRELNEAHRSLAERYSELEAAFKTAAVGLCQVDQDWKVVRASKLFVTLVDREGANLAGTPLDEVCPSLGIIARAEIFGPKDAERVEPTSIRLEVSGRSREWLVGVNPVITTAGEPSGYSIAVKDITERTNLERQARQSQKMDAIGQLASGVAHDINNTLLAIYGYLSITRAQIGEDHPASTSLDKISLAAEQTARMTQALLAFARPDPPKRDLIEFSSVLALALPLVRGLLPARIEIITDLSPTQNVWIKADPTQLQQVLLNLAINARDAMPDGGRLDIRTAADGTWVTLSVADSGSGIPESALPRIFDPFFTTKPRGEGTGLGLSIVQGIVRAHQAEIDVASKIGSGTKFTVRFRRCEPPLAAIEQAREAHALPLPGAMVILADDNRHVRELVAMQIRRGGYNVVEARDGLEFLDLAERTGRSAAAYILDIDMPGRSGIDCLRDLRAKENRTPAIIISGGKEHALPPDEMSVLLHKPFSSQDILRSLNNLIAKQARGKM